MTVHSDTFLRKVLQRTQVIACVGVSDNPVRPSYYLARYLSLKGFRVIPVNPALAGRRLFGETACASLSDIPPQVGRVQMVDIFRRSEHVGPIVDEAIAALGNRGLQTIWMQFDVINEAAAAMAREAGLDVVMDRCPKLEYQRLCGELRMGGFNTGIVSSKL